MIYSKFDEDTFYQEENKTDELVCKEVAKYYDKSIYLKLIYELTKEPLSINEQLNIVDSFNLELSEKLLSKDSIYSENYKFKFGKAVLIEDGTDATIITNGETLAETIEATEMLKKDGYSIKVLHMPTVKPIDKDAIIENARKTGLIITVENHSIINGLGSAVCEVVSENAPIPVKRIGVNDEFGQSGKWNYLLDYYGLSAEKLAVSFKKEIDKHKKCL